MTAAELKELTAGKEYHVYCDGPGPIPDKDYGTGQLNDAWDVEGHNLVGLAICHTTWTGINEFIVEENGCIKGYYDSAEFPSPKYRKGCLCLTPASGRPSI